MNRDLPASTTNKRHTLFICVTGAGSSRRVSELIGGSVASGWTTYVVATPNVSLVMDPSALLDVPGSAWILDYGHPPLDRFPFGTLLVAPCTFNTFNKLAHGIADNLPTAMIADAIGAGCPVFIAPSMNRGLWNHPQTRESYRRLTSWGCTIIDPIIDAESVTIASNGVILERLQMHFG